MDGNFTPLSGWTDNNTRPRMMADVNGDGRADIVGFGSNSVWVSLNNGLNNGTGFNSPMPMGNAFTDKGGGGWTDNNTYPRFMADVNGDGKADIVGFADVGVFVGINNGSGFVRQPQAWTANFGTSQGWTDNNTYPRMMANVTGTKINGHRVFGPVGLAVNTADIMKSNGTGFVAAPGQ